MKLKQAERNGQPWMMAAKCSCWYCNQPLNEMRRFCDKSCAEAFDEDEAAMQRRMLANWDALTAISA